MSVILIGMPSCGKSTLGVLLAKRLGMRFIDSDLLIQEREGKLLHEIIGEVGTDGFIAIENLVNRNITDRNAVISTGGSAVYGKEAMEHLKTLGKVVYLRISYSEMEKRLGDYVHRGVVIKKGHTLADMYKERVALYEKYADIIVDGTNDISNTLDLIAEKIR
ncbi:MAG: shikimate kinase [Clostridia bacterium]|nr:shikimate kinase [Clostridia bacterium]